MNRHSLSVATEFRDVEQRSKSTCTGSVASMEYADVCLTTDCDIQYVAPGLIDGACNGLPATDYGIPACSASYLRPRTT